MTTPDPHETRNASDPAADSTLAVIDDALGSGRVTSDDPSERELQELALAVSADAPEPRPDFAERLGRRAGAGFPIEHPGRVRRGGRRLAARARRARSTYRPAPADGRVRGWRPPMPVVAGAASLLLALVVGVSLYAGSPDRQPSPMLTDDAPIAGPEPSTQAPDSAPSEGGPSAGDKSAPETSAQALPDGDGERAIDPSIGDSPVTVPPPVPPPGGGGEALGERDRRVQRSASLTLAAPADELGEAAAGINEVAQRRRGFVLTSSITTGQDGVGGGTFELRVPVTELDATLADLADLGQVRSQTRTDDDVTAVFSSIEDRLRAASAEQRGLRRRLARAETELEARGIRQRLRAVTGEIDRTRAELRTADRRTAFAAVSVSLTEGGDGGGGGTGEALEDALDSLVGALNFALRALGVLVPLAVLALLAWLAWRAMQRRRRESELR